MKKELFKKALEILEEISNKDVQELYKMKEDKKGKKTFKEIKKSLKENSIDLKDLNQKQRAELGFRTWSEESEENGLIPLYIFYVIKGKTKLICPLNSSKGETKIAKECDDDTRGGCIAYEFFRE